MNNTTKKYKLLAHSLLLGTVFLAGGCSSNIKDSLGLNKASPDEFSVVTRPPLSVPKDYTLRAPTKDQEFAHPASLEEAKALLLSTSATYQYVPTPPVSEGPLRLSSTDAVFLQQTGVESRTNIRDILYTEVPQPSEQNPGIIKSLFTKEKKADNDPIVDAIKEKQRIQEKKANNVPINGQDTPIIKQEDRGIIDAILKQSDS